MEIENEATAVEAVEPTVMPEAQPAAEAQAIEATPRNAIDRAFDAVDKMDTDQSPQKATGVQKQVNGATGAKTDERPAGDRERNPDGTFKAKSADSKEQDEDTVALQNDKSGSFGDAPNRFSPDAKGVWKDAPLEVRAEVHRMEKEFSAGLERYKAGAEAFEEFRPFAEQLQQTGQNFADVVGHYTGLEQLLARDPVQGLDTICRNLGTDLQSVAAHVLGQTPDENAQQQNSIIHELQQEIGGLKQQLGGVSDTLTNQSIQVVQSQIDEFALSNPRFDELSDDMTFFLDSGRAQDLQEAYELADRLNPGSQQWATAQQAAQTRDPQAEAAHTRKGQLSVSGAPGTGSNPANRKPPATARAAIDDAFASLGIG